MDVNDTVKKRWNDISKEDEFHRKFLWYLDEGMKKVSRRQALIELSNTIGTSYDVMYHWVYRVQPAQWKLLLVYLEMKYGRPPAEVWSD